MEEFAYTETLEEKQQIANNSSGKVVTKTAKNAMFFMLLPGDSFR